MSQLLETFSQFSERRVVTRERIIELKSVYDFSALRDLDKSSGGSVTNNGVEYKLSTTTTTSDTAELRSAERARYTPGHEIEIGIAVRIPSTPTGSQSVIFGYFDDDDGFFWGLDKDGIFINTRRGGTDGSKVRPSNFSNDSLSDIDLDHGVIFHITFSWYGYGVVEFSVIWADENDANYQRRVTAHRILDRTGQTSVKNPNLPISCKIDNSGESNALDAFVAGRSAYIVGQFDPNRRKNFERVTGISVGTSGWTFALAVRKRSGRLNTSVKLDDLIVISDNEVIVEVRHDVDITTNNFGAPTRTTQKETAIESSTSETVNTDPSGEIIDGTIVEGGSTGNSLSRGAEELNDFDFVEDKPIVVLMQATNSAATVDIFFKWREEW